MRRRIDRALSAGELRGPDGLTSEWTVRDSRPGAVTSDEVEGA